MSVSAKKVGKNKYQIYIVRDYTNSNCQHEPRYSYGSYDGVACTPVWKCEKCRRELFEQETIHIQSNFGEFSIIFLTT